MAVQQDRDADAQKRPPRRRSRWAAGLLTVVGIAGAGGLSMLTAGTAADYIAQRLTADARAALAGGGFDWVAIRTDGTQVHVSGTAPDEVARFRALSAVTRVTEAGRVIDDMQVAAIAALETPDFEVELLRNDDGISIIGLVPARMDRASVVEGLRQRTGVQNISDLLETADYDVPAQWDEALAFGLRAAQLAPRAKISVEPGRVTVRAIADSREERIALEQALRRNKPTNVALSTDVSAPRPVISPFTLRFVLDDQGARFDACAADGDLGRSEILAAGLRAGVSGQAVCQLGLGAPSKDWGRAAALSIDALHGLGAGSVTLSDTDVALLAPASVAKAAFDETAARLETALPAPFTLTARQEEIPAGEGPTEFIATIAAPGHAVLRGRIGGPRMRDAVESLARSRFGQVDSALRVDPEAPGGWTLKVIAGIEAMAGLDRGTVTVTPDLIRITGVSGDRTASDAVAARLAGRLGAGASYELAIRYDRRLDPLLALPSGEECVDRLNTVMGESLIGFEPSKSVIAGDPAPTLTELGEAMTDCGDFRIEIGGHTDSQGSESFNQQLSHRRAQAVLDAMTEAGLPTKLVISRGYGEAEPIADNDTEAGREANRRIEFRLLDSHPIVQTPTAPPRTVSGVTDDGSGDPVDTPEAALDEAASAVAVAIIREPVLNDAPAAVGIDPLTPDERAAREESFRSHAAMIATIIVSELLASPERAIDTAADMGDEGDGLPGGVDPLLIELATRPVASLIESGPAASTVGPQDGLSPDAPHLAATTAIAVTGAGLRIQTPDDDTPRPSRRPPN